MITRTPRIAYVTTPITFGGAERVNLNFLNYVDRDKFTLEPILFLRPWEGVNLFEAELKRMSLNYHTIPVAKSMKNDFLQLIRRFLVLKKIISSNSYDLIHSHGYMADILCYLVSKTLKIPIMSTCHGFIYADKRLSLYNTIDRFVLKRFIRIITVSTKLKEDLLTSGITEDKIRVIENAPTPYLIGDETENVRRVLRSKINVEPDEILIGYIGRLSREKGVKFLLESIKLINCGSQQIKLVIIGEGPQIEELTDQVRSNNLSSKVIFTGFQNNIDEWLEAIDIFVLPSLTEGTPMVLLEAMSHGVPCIASAVGGIPNVIESGVDGIIIPPGKPAEINKAIYSLICDSVKKDLISKNAVNKILTKYNINDWTRKIENEYLNIFNTLN